MSGKVWDKITYPVQNSNGFNPWSLGMDKYFHLINFSNFIAIVTNKSALSAIRSGYVQQNQHIDADKNMDVISQTTYSNPFLWSKIAVFCLEFHSSFSEQSN